MNRIPIFSTKKFTQNLLSLFTDKVPRNLFRLFIDNGRSWELSAEIVDNELIINIKSYKLVIVESLNKKQIWFYKVDGLK